MFYLNIEHHIYQVALPPLYNNEANARAIEFVVADDPEEKVLYITWVEGYIQVISKNLEEGIDSAIDELQAAYIALGTQLHKEGSLDEQSLELWNKITGNNLIAKPKAITN